VPSAPEIEPETSYTPQERTLKVTEMTRQTEKLNQNPHETVEKHWNPNFPYRLVTLVKNTGALPRKPARKIVIGRQIIVQWFYFCV
jgi:hypothetical protein